jgi:hypothetical protein
MAKQLRFLILDLCSPTNEGPTSPLLGDSRDELRTKVATALKELFDFVALQSATLTFVMALFVAHDSGVEVFLKPQKFQLGTYREVCAADWHVLLTRHGLRQYRK